MGMDKQNEHDSRKIILEQVQRIVLQELSGIPARIYWFGSWARGNPKRSSDIDIAIEFAPEASETRSVLIKLRNALEESSVPYNIDVLDLNSAEEAIVDKVMKEGILWDVQRSG